MLHEKSRRPPKLYIKLEEGKPYAITWLADACKVCKLFCTDADRSIWLDSSEGLRIAASGKILKKEDGYICKSKLGMVIDIDTNHPIYDEYTGDGNVGLLDLMIGDAENRYNAVKNRRAAIRNGIKRIKEIEKEISTAELEISFMLEKEFRTIVSSVEKLIEGRR